MSAIDFEAFRLRRLVERLAAAGEVETHAEPVPLSGLSAIIEASDKAVLFRAAGPEHFEIIGGVAGSRPRLAIAFGVSGHELAREYLRRMKEPQSVVEVPSADAPVHQVIVTGDEVDATRLPFYLQHQLDGAPYISSAVDFSVDPLTAKRNVGCRRLMLCGRRELRANLTQASDLKSMYLATASRGKDLPVNFAIGTHPADLLAATTRLPVDEFALIGTLRGRPLPMVKALTNDRLVPADAELVIEGYFDKEGYVEREGPYGELLGFYGPVHENPIYRVTAITRRSDALHQTLLHGTARLARTETGQLGAVLLEAEIWQLLQRAGLDVIAVNGCPSTGGMVTARAAIRPRSPGDGRSAVEAMLSVPFLKQVVVTDDSIDVFCDEAVEWAMSSRFQPERDLITSPAQRAFPMDLTAGPDGMLTKIGYDLTLPLSVAGIRATVSAAPAIVPKRRFASVKDALAEGPKNFADLMEDLGSEDGREIVRELEVLRSAQPLLRSADGEWSLGEVVTQCPS